MRILLVGIFVLFTGVVFAATGDKPNQIKPPFRNISTSTKPASCVAGEVKFNKAYLFVCYSSGGWRRVSLGSAF